MWMKLYLMLKNIYVKMELYFNPYINITCFTAKGSILPIDLYSHNTKFEAVPTIFLISRIYGKDP